MRGPVLPQRRAIRGLGIASGASDLKFLRAGGNAYSSFNCKTALESKICRRLPVKSGDYPGCNNRVDALSQATVGGLD